MGQPEKRGQLPPGEPQVSGEKPLLLGEGQANYVEATCPVCEAPRAMLRTVALDLPFFGEVFETIFLCGKCGFRHADTMIPRVQAPVEYTIRVEGDEDLFVRVVKSSSATVSVPELGLLWEPGPASVAEVTNVEGLLRRFEDAVHRAEALFGAEETRERAGELLGDLQRIIDGERSATLCLQDPYGNSALLDPRGKAARRELTPEEAGALLTGEYILEVSGGKPAGVRRHGAPS